MSWELQVSSTPGGPSGCTVTTQALGDTTCLGVAQMRTGLAPELVLGDGSVFTWNPSRATVAVAPPKVDSGATVWLEYTKRTTVVCPFCGAFETVSLTLRRSQGGELIWMARESPRQDDITVDDARDLFGVSFSERGSCVSSFTGGCSKVRRTVYEHVLATTPERAIAPGTLERVVTPKGEFEVVWTHSREVSNPIPLCADGPGVASDTAFAVSRL
jgi:hypothetical protein